MLLKAVQEFNKIRPYVDRGTISGSLEPGKPLEDGELKRCLDKRLIFDSKSNLSFCEAHCRWTAAGTVVTKEYEAQRIQKGGSSEITGAEATPRRGGKRGQMMLDHRGGEEEPRKA